MSKSIAMIILIVWSLTTGVYAQQATLEQKIAQATSTYKATVGVAIHCLDNQCDFAQLGDQHVPMQSVFKFHIALAILHEVDKGRFTLGQKIWVKKSDLLPDTWSPMREQYPKGNLSITLARILQYTVAQSDNNGCDILLRLLGGPAAVQRYIRSVGINDIAIAVNEQQMHEAWDQQFKNWTTPKAANALLEKFYHRQLLSPNTHDFLWKTVTANQTGDKRLKGRLPKGTLVADKTGTSGTNNQGITAAVNDVAIIRLPNGRHFAISVFVTESKEDAATNEKIIADIGRLAWDYLLSASK